MKGQALKLDTNKGENTKDMVEEPPITTKLKLSKEEMNIIYAEMKNIDILSYPDRFNLKSKSWICSEEILWSYFRIQGKMEVCMYETNRCRLSKIQDTDYEEVKKLYTNEKVRQFLGGVVEEKIYRIKFADMCDAKDDSFYWVIRHKDDNQFIGLVSLDLHHDGINTEISYQLLPNWWGYGYATEIIQEIIGYAFEELGIERIVAETQSENKQSCKLLRKIGMSLEETVQRLGAEQSIFSIRNTRIIKCGNWLKMQK